MIRRVVVRSSCRVFFPFIFLALCAICIHAQSNQARSGSGPNFLTAPFVSLSANPTSVAAGDLNGDGKLDLVVTKKGSADVTVLLGDGKGGFAPGVEYPAGAQPGNALLADLNGDGKLDLVVTDSDSGAIDVLIGNGDGTFGKPSSYAALQNPIALALGNFRGKGEIDLAVASSTGLAVLLNDGSGHFPNATSLRIGAQPTSLTAADLKGAGHDDLILANAGGSVSVLVGDGTGNFTPLTAQSVASGPLSSVVAGDFNGDGKPDLAITQPNSGALTVLLGRGDGTFQTGASYAVGNGPASVRAANLTGNGVTDLITVNRAANSFSVLLGNGDGTFKPAAEFVAGNAPLALATGDFNADGHPDLAIVNSQDGTVSVPLGLGDGSFIAARAYKSGLQTNAIASGDLNGDGLPDLVVTNYCGSDSACASEGSANVFLANKDGSYRAASTITLGSGPVAVALADLNGDKKLDLVALNRNDKTMMVMLGNGDGTFGSPQIYSLPASPRALFVGDFNGDKIPDLAIASDCGQTTCTEPGSLEVWLGRGDGSLAASASYPVGYSPVSVAAADLDGTGHLDLVVANACGDAAACQSDGTATLLAGDGAGKFTAAGQLDIGKSPTAIALGNLSGSGLDLAVAQRGSNQVAVFHANSSGSFGAPAVYPVGAAPSALAIADFNGDGKQDLAVANFQSSTVSVLNGTGSGPLEAAQTYTAATGPESLVAIGAGAGHAAGLASANGNTGANPLGNVITLFRIQPQANPPATVSVSVSPATATVDQSEVLTANLTGAADTPPTGTVTFSSALTTNVVCAESTDTPKDGTVPSTVVSTPNGTATATCTTTSLVAGSDTITATYGTDSNFTGGSGTAPLTINAATTSTSVALTAGSNPSTVDSSLTFTATVNAPSGATVPLTGAVTFTDNGSAITNGSNCGTAGAVNVTWNSSSATGTATCTTSALVAGSHAITATYNANAADTNYNSSDNFVTQTVNQASGTMTFTSSSTADTSLINQSVTLTATLTPSTGSTTVPFSGTFTFTDNGGPVAGCTVSFNTSTGIATCTTSSLALGAHPLKATYSNDPSYQFTAQSFTQTVNQGSTTIAIGTSNGAPAVNAQVTLTATVTPNPSGPTKLSGSVTFTDTPQGGSGVTICSNVAVSPSTGQATCTDSWPSAGTHAISAAYANDANFTGSTTTTSATETVGAASTTTTLASSAPSATVNQSPSVVFTATITESPVGTAGLHGTVNFTDNGTSIAGCSAVSPGATSGSGTATAVCTDPGLTAVGSPHSILATYGNDPNFGGSSNNPALSETVSPAAATVALQSSAPSSVTNQSVTFTAQITPTTPIPSGGVALSGKVSFTDTPSGGSASAISGCTNVALVIVGGVAQATCTTSSLALGSHTIAAAYGSDANFTAATPGTVTQTVSAASSAIALTSSATGNTSTVNQTVVFTASILVPTGPNNPTGTFAFTDNGTTICSGVAPIAVTGTNNWTAPCTDSSLIAGSHTIVSAYSGDTHFTYSNGSLTQTVNPGSTTVSLASTQNPSVVNQSITFQAIITPNPSGAVALSGKVGFVDSVTSQSITGCSAVSLTVVSGNSVATCSTSALAVGAHTITATYASDANFTGNFSTFVQTVNAATSSISLSSSTGGASTVNQSVAFKAIVPVPSGQTPSGTVNFTDNGNPAAGTGCTNASLTLQSGVYFATCTDQSLTAGAHTIVASYGGDKNLTVANNDVVQQVAQGQSQTVLTSNLSPAFLAADNPNNFKDSVIFTAAVSVVPPAGSTVVVPLSVGTVSFSVNGIAICTGATVTSGVATCATSTTAAAGFTGGTNGVVATYTGDPNYQTSSGPFNQLIEDYTISVSPVPANAIGVLVTQGFTTANDPFAPAALSVTPVSTANFTGSPALTCAGSGAGAPTCGFASTSATSCQATATLAIAASGVQPSIGVCVDATKATPGTYTMTMTATDPTTGIVRTTTFPVTVRALSAPLTVVSGQTTNNQATISFSLPAGVSLALTSSSCGLATGPELSSAVNPQTLFISCSFTPSSVPSSASPQTASVTATLTTGSGTTSSLDRHSTLFFAGLLGLPIFGLFGLLGGRKSTRTIFLRLLAVAAICLAGWQISGCGGSFHGSSTVTSGGQTPPGSYYVLVTGTGSDSNTYEAVIQLNVTL